MKKIKYVIVCKARELLQNIKQEENKILKGELKNGNKRNKKW